MDYRVKKALNNAQKEVFTIKGTSNLINSKLKELEELKKIKEPTKGQISDIEQLTIFESVKTWRKSAKFRLSNTKKEDKECRNIRNKKERILFFVVIVNVQVVIGNLLKGIERINRPTNRKKLI